MSNDPLPPVPTPMLQRWREFRIRVMPLVFFVAIGVPIVLLWREVAVPPMLGVGFAETNIAHVAAPLPGFVAQMGVRRFQQVRAGELICQVIIKDPKILASELAVVEAQIQLIRTGMAPIVDIERTILDYYQLRLNLMAQRVAQATQIIEMRQAQDDFRRAQELFTNNPVISQSQYELFKTKAEALETSVRERSNLLVNLDRDLKNFALPEVVQNSLNPISAAVAVQEAKLHEIEVAEGPRPLYAPIDGIVAFVHRRSGEAVVAGDPILTINSVQSEQVVAYIRQPLSYQPKPGMIVHIRSRSPRRESAEATLIQVGAQMEPYNTTMLPFPALHPQEWGLPVQISMPAGLRLFPGEFVDITFDSRTANR